jgi:cell division septation protein DedD
MVHDYARRQIRGNPKPPADPVKWLLIVCILSALFGIGWLVKSMVGPLPDFITEFKSTKEKLLTHAKSAADETSKAVTHAKDKVLAASKQQKKEEVKQTKILPEPTKPKFDFYTLLPQMEMTSTIEPEKKPLLATTNVNKSKGYVLQIALLQTAIAAQELIDRLSLLGVEAEVQTEQKDGKPLIRVISKPYPNQETAMDARKRLKNNQIDSFLISN